MPTPRHGKNAYLAIVVAGTTTALKTTFNDSGLQRAVESADVTVYGDGDRKYLAGLRTGSFSMGGHWDRTFALVLEGVAGASTNPTFIYGPEGNSTNYQKYSFTGVLNKLDVGSPVGDKVSMSCGVQISGAVLSTQF